MTEQRANHLGNIVATVVILSLVVGMVAWLLSWLDSEGKKLALEREAREAELVRNGPAPIPFPNPITLTTNGMIESCPLDTGAEIRFVPKTWFESRKAMVPYLCPSQGPIGVEFNVSDDGSRVHMNFRYPRTEVAR